MIDALLYVCPKDRQPLMSRSPDVLLCPLCQTHYPLADGIALLDIHQSPEAAAFDEQHQDSQTLDAASRQESLQQTARFLDALQPNLALQGKTVLDIGCGHGALTYGLAYGPRVQDSEIYAFDHSVASLRVLAQSVAGEQSTNRLHLSAQDVYAMAYPDQFFNLIFGNAVLHHFLDVENVLAACYQILKPGGAAIFAEPFAHGYALGALLLQLGMRESGVGAETPGTGLLGFITNDIAFRIQHANQRESLAGLTDKHFFTDEWAVKTGTRMGFTVDTVPYEPPEFYEYYIDVLLNSYGIEDPSLRRSCLEIYAETRRYLGDALPTLFSHYKFIVLRK